MNRNFPERAGRRHGPAITMLAWLACLVGPAVAGHSVDKSLAQLVAEAEAIELVRLESAQPRWNDRGNLIVTDFRFRRERDLLGEGAPGTLLELSQGGGVVGNEGHAMSGNPSLQVGERYLLFVSPERGEVFAPFVAGEQGVYRVDSEGVARPLSGQPGTHVDALIADVDRLVRQRGDAPAVRYRAAGPGNQALPAKAYVPAAIARPASGGHGSGTPVAPGQAPSPEGPGLPVMTAEPDRGADTSPPWATPRYQYGPTVPFPVVYDELPHDWTWSPHDQYQMSAWNSYANGNLFLISNAQQGSWAWTNNRFELVGWPDNQTMINQFGQGWGANTLAITWSRWNTTTNVILEADIAFNPAFCWTLDTFEGADPAGCWSFQQTMLHELGHGWGLNHPWETQDVWWDSVMNYAPKQYRLARLNTDDVNALRARYGGPALSGTLLSQWRTSDNAGSMHATYTAALPFSQTIRHGQNLSLSGPIQIENLGTVNFVNPAIEIYLSQNWHSWTDSYVYLRTANYTSTIGTFSTFTYNVNPTMIASTVPTGSYYLTMWLDNGAGSTFNNTSSSDPDITVTIRNNETSLAPIEGWRVTGTGRIGPLGVWDFWLPVVAGRTYELTTCTGNGGSAGFDTKIEIVGSGGTINDDYCGLQSRVLWTAPSTGTRTVRVSGYAIGSQGDFVLAYRQVVSDRIFGNGFQP